MKAAYVADRPKLGGEPMPDVIPVNADLELKKYTWADVPAYAAMIQGSEDFLAPMLPWAAGYSLQKARIEFAGILSKRIDSNEYAGYLVNYRDNPVAFANLHTREASSAQVGYWKTIEAPRGVVTRAARQLIDTGAAAWLLKRVDFHIKPANIPSQRVAQNLGAVKTPTTVYRVESGEKVPFDLWSKHI